MRFCLTRSTIAPSWMPTPSSVRTTSPPPSEVDTPTRARCAARVAVAHTSAKASDSTTRVTVVVTRLSSPFAAGASSSWSASAARGGSPRPAMPSNTSRGDLLEVDLGVDRLHGLVDDHRLHRGVVHERRQRRDERVLVDSCTRAHAPTIETGTRMAAMTMHSAERNARHHPLRRRVAGATSSGATAPPPECFVLGAQCGEFGLQVDGVWLAHEASSSRMPLIVAYDATVRHHPFRDEIRPTAALRPRGAPRRPCRARWPRRRGSARTPSCGGAATCGRRAGGTS